MVALRFCLSPLKSPIERALAAAQTTRKLPLRALPIFSIREKRIRSTPKSLRPSVNRLLPNSRAAFGLFNDKLRAV